MPKVSGGEDCAGVDSKRRARRCPLRGSPRLPRPPHLPILPRLRVMRSRLSRLCPCFPRPLPGACADESQIHILNLEQVGLDESRTKLELKNPKRSSGVDETRRRDDGSGKARRGIGCGGRVDVDGERRRWKRRRACGECLLLVLGGGGGAGRRETRTIRACPCPCPRPSAPSSRSRHESISPLPLPSKLDSSIR
jgi:hypothetical protein